MQPGTPLKHEENFNMSNNHFKLADAGWGGNPGRPVKHLSSDLPSIPLRQLNALISLLEAFEKFLKALISRFSRLFWSITTARLPGSLFALPILNFSTKSWPLMV